MHTFSPSLFLVLMLCGCTGIGQLQREFVYAREAEQVLAADSGFLASGPESRHYARGFKAGYIHLLKTGDTHLPVIAPQQYQSVHYESSAGQLAIESWFAGYQSGLAAAQTSPRQEFRTVARRFDPPVLTPVHMACPAPGNWTFESDFLMESELPLNSPSSFVP